MFFAWNFFTSVILIFWLLSNGTVPNNRKVNQATCLESAKNIINLSKALGPGAGGREPNKSNSQLFQVSEENILFSTRKTPRNV